jgi:hypothetical protein
VELSVIWSLGNTHLVPGEASGFCKCDTARTTIDDEAADTMAL